jgi:hypothetical protein
MNRLYLFTFTPPNPQAGQANSENKIPQPAFISIDDILKD